MPRQPANVLHDSRQSSVEDPRVTVCVTLYNYQCYVIECLESVRAQTLAPLALVVVDDASDDAGPEAVRAWMEEHGERFDRLLLLQHRENAGVASARNTGAASAETEFVFILDADNQIYPRCLERLLHALERSGLDFAYSIIEQFGDVRGVVGCDGWSRQRLARGNYVDAMAMLRKNTWETIGGYQSMRTGGWEDFGFWCRCVEAGLEGVLVPEILCRYRVHRRSMLRSSTDTLRNHLRVCEEIRREHPWVEL